MGVGMLLTLILLKLNPTLSSLIVGHTSTKRYDASHRILNVHLSSSLPSSTWMNLGLWDPPPSSPSSPPQITPPPSSSEFAVAAHNLASALASHANLSSTLHRKRMVLDAGCGCGDSLLVWKHLLADDATTILGVSGSASQAAIARSKTEGHEDVDVVHGDAVSYLSSTPLPNLAAVLSLDADYHFNTRAAFAAHAFTALDPDAGGVYAIAGLFPGTPLSSLPWWKRITLSALLLCAGVPLSNFDRDMDAYASFLETEVGYVDVSVEDISHRVFPGFAAFMETTQARGASLPGVWNMGSLAKYRMASRIFLWGYTSGFLRFALVAGHKPPS